MTEQEQSKTILEMFKALPEIEQYYLLLDIIEFMEETDPNMLRDMARC